MSELFKRSKPKSSFAELSKLIHGFIKTGKSTLAAQMKVGTKEPLFVATEDGHHNLDVMVENVFNWNEFKKNVAKIEQHKLAVQKDFSCIVIDLVSDLDRWCEDEVCKQLNVKHVSDAQWGKGYSAHRLELQKEFAKLFAILPLTFISHSKEKTVEMGGEKYDMYSPNLSNNCLDYINGKVDAVGFIIPASKKKPVPQITFRPSTVAIAGTRYSHIAKEFDLSTTDMKSSYEAIEAEFTSGLKKQ
jgi:hypothetical protein